MRAEVKALWDAMRDASGRMTALYDAGDRATVGEERRAFYAQARVASDEFRALHSKINEKRPRKPRRKVAA